ncbi:glutathione peroxidase [Kamptonema cortianum]|nr:glutathione peroxidase [Geitlerinema splendidum]MDK3156039.1 glutathione peroxidase [Kamptonema cortianum]
MKLVLFVVLALMGVVALAFMFVPKQTTPVNTDAKSIYDFEMTSISGENVPLKKFEGQAILVVNVASKCGMTPQYEGLEKLYKQYKEAGLVVLGFPSNDFLGQEPGTNEEIAQFCSSTYGVTFPMFSKIQVKGEGAHPLYQWLIGQTEEKKDIDWNFAKFLVGRDGKVIKRFPARTKPESEEVVAAIKQALAN